MLEIWRTAIYKGVIYEGLYKVSNLGRILSLNYNHTGKSKLMKLFETKKGYLQVRLYKDSESKWCRAHRLVAETFLENPENKPQVNHKDEDKTNNFVFLNEDGSVDKEKSNLEWKTPKENSNHGTRNERIAKANTNRNKSKKVLQFSKSGEFIREWASLMECSRDGFGFRNVSSCRLGKIKSAYGYIWRYK